MPFSDNHAQNILRQTVLPSILYKVPLKSRLSLSETNAKLKIETRNYYNTFTDQLSPRSTLIWGGGELLIVIESVLDTLLDVCLKYFVHDCLKCVKNGSIQIRFKSSRKMVGQ